MFLAAEPVYIGVYGMTYEQFWFGDPWIAASYRRAYVARRKEENLRDWLQGAYYYNAVSTALSNAFRKKGQSPINYLARPLSLSLLLYKQETVPPP